MLHRIHNVTTKEHPMAWGKAKVKLKGSAAEVRPSVPQASQSRTTPRPASKKASKKKPKVRKVHRVRIDNIQLVGKRRACDPEKVRELAQSMASIGLNDPITLQSGWGKAKLVTGRHRLEAAKSLGWEYIDAFVRGGDNFDARLWEIAENLHRAELRTLERSELTVEWEKLIKEKAVQVAQPAAGGMQPHDAGISKGARDLGLSREKIRRARVIAGISAEAKAKAIAEKLDDNQSALLEVADENTTEAQLKKIAEIVGRKGRQDGNSKRRKLPGSDGSERKGHPTKIPPNGVLFAKLKSDCPTSFRKTWAVAPPAVRRRFLREVLKWEGGKPLPDKT
jgi:ParB/RepB/Spo0J family partition protein